MIFRLYITSNFTANIDCCVETIHNVQEICYRHTFQIIRDETLFPEPSTFVVFADDNWALKSNPHLFMLLITVIIRRFYIL